MSIADAQKIIDLVAEIKAQRRHKTDPLQSDDYNRYLLDLLDKLESANENIQMSMEETTLDVPAPNQAQELEVPLPTTKVYRSKAKRTKYLQDIGVSEEVIKRLARPERIKKLTQIDYTVYRPNLYGKIANGFCRPLSVYLIERHPDFFKKFHQALRMSDIKVLVRTYVSMMLFSTSLVFFAGTALAVLGTLFLAKNIIVALATSIAVVIALTILVFVLFNIYPSVVVGSRNRIMKNDLPFAIMHMAAITGSGAQPIAMFKLLLNAGEYKGLESEIKKIVNYVNLFGYNLSAAMKTVAATTPSKRFRDLLSGIAATVESGGSLKSYLNSMADDTMNMYKLERKKYIETLSTYSDIYTGILIAAPLLFIVTLAIINILGGGIGGITVGTLAMFGTYLVIPFLNIAFILFLNIVQPE